MSDSVCGLVLAKRGGTKGDSLCIWNNDCSRMDEIDGMLLFVVVLFISLYMFVSLL